MSWKSCRSNAKKQIYSYCLMEPQRRFGNVSWLQIKWKKKIRNKTKNQNRSKIKMIKWKFDFCFFLYVLLFISFWGQNVWNASKYGISQFCLVFVFVMCAKNVWKGSDLVVLFRQSEKVDVVALQKIYLPCRRSS